MRIAMPRGDIKKVAFQVANPDKSISEVEFDEIYFTVKKDCNAREPLFQKRLSTGGIIKTDTGTYQITIRPEDTNRLQYGEYRFDIELCYADEIKQTTVGRFALMDEVTFAENEV